MKTEMSQLSQSERVILAKHIISTLENYDDNHIEKFEHCRNFNEITKLIVQ